MKRTAMLVVVVLSLALPSFAAQKPRHETPRVDVIGVPAPAVAEDWPSIASEQRRHVIILGCGGSNPGCEPDPIGDGGGSGGTEWGLCQDNHKCEAVDTGQCVTTANNKCKVRLSGQGDPCTSCT